MAVLRGVAFVVLVVIVIMVVVIIVVVIIVVFIIIIIISFLSFSSTSSSVARSIPPWRPCTRTFLEPMVTITMHDDDDDDGYTACETRANLAPTQIIAYEEAVRLRDFESSTTEQVLNQAPKIYFTYVHMERWGIHAIGNGQQQSIMPSQSQTHDSHMYIWRGGASTRLVTNNNRASCRAKSRRMIHICTYGEVGRPRDW